MGQIKAKTHLEKLGFMDKDKKSSKHDIIQRWADVNIEKIIAETVMKKNPHPYIVKKAKWEHQIMFINGNYRMLVGYIDLMVQIEGSFYFSDTKKYEECTEEVFIEVKTAIPVLGELIRQLRAYQAYQTKRTEYIVVAPDDSHSKTLKEQGIWFYKYKDPTQLF